MMTDEEIIDRSEEIPCTNGRAHWKANPLYGLTVTYWKCCMITANITIETNGTNGIARRNRLDNPVLKSEKSVVLKHINELKVSEGQSLLQYETYDTPNKFYNRVQIDMKKKNYWMYQEPSWMETQS